MTTTDDTARGRSLTPAEAEAVLLVRTGRSRQEAAKESGLSLEQVSSALARAEHHRAQRIVPAAVPAPRVPAPQPTAAVHTPPTQPDGIDTLLRWAERSDMPRANTLAVRARGIIDELLELHTRGKKIRVAKKAITVLEQQLKRAKADLREASGKPHPPTAAKVPDDPASREERDRIRAWARENGHAVAERGKIAESVAAAYRAATGTP